MGSSPAQRLLGRRCKTQLPTTKELLKPQYVRAEAAVKKETRVGQAHQAKHYNKGTRDLSPLEEGDVVRVKPFRLGQKEWGKATVAKRHEERSYEVESANGTYRRNRVDLKQQPSPPKPTDQQLKPPKPSDQQQPGRDSEQRTKPSWDKQNCVSSTKGTAIHTSYCSSPRMPQENQMGASISQGLCSLGT